MQRFLVGGSLKCKFLAGRPLQRKLFYILSLKNMQFNFILHHFSCHICVERVEKTRVNNTHTTPRKRNDRWFMVVLKTPRKKNSTHVPLREVRIFWGLLKCAKTFFLSAEYLCRQIGNPSAWKYNLLTNKYSDSWNHISKILHAEMIWFTVLKCGTNNSHRSRLSVRRSLSFLPTVTRFWLLTFPPHRPYLLSFHSPWAVWCVALLKRLFLPRVVLISNKRGCRTRGGGGIELALLLSSLSVSMFLFSPLQRITWPCASPLSPPLVFLSRFFYPYRSQSHAP